MTDQHKKWLMILGGVVAVGAVYNYLKPKTNPMAGVLTGQAGGQQVLDTVQHASSTGDADGLGDVLEDLAGGWGAHSFNGTHVKRKPPRFSN